METKYFEYWLQRETMLSGELLLGTIVICIKAANFAEAYAAASSTGEPIELIREIDERTYYILSGDTPADNVDVVQTV